MLADHGLRLPGRPTLLHEAEIYVQGLSAAVYGLAREQPTHGWTNLVQTHLQELNFLVIFIMQRHNNNLLFQI